MAIVEILVDEGEDLVFEVRGMDIEAFPSDGSNERREGGEVGGFLVCGGECRCGLDRF